MVKAFYWTVRVPTEDLMILNGSYKSGLLGSMLDFRADFFPRQFYYKKDAKDFMEEVKGRGGNPSLTHELKIERS